MKYQNDFRSAVVAGANAGGDTDTIAAMIGALIGTKIGYHDIPSEFFIGLEEKLTLMRCADALYNEAIKLIRS